MTHRFLRTVLLLSAGLACLAGCARRDAVASDAEDLRDDLRSAGQRVISETEDLVNRARD